MSDIFHRQLNQSDAAAMYELFKASIEESWANLGITPEELDHMGVPYFEALVQNLEQMQLGIFIGTFNMENQLIACAGFTRNERLCSRHTARIIGVVVSSAMRGKGYGSSLLKQVIQSCALSNIEQLTIDTADSGTEATKLYQKLNFNLYGREVSAIRYAGETYDRLLLSREISSSDASIV